MPTIEENRENWTQYSWSQDGDEWSGFWGGTETLWWGTMLPRIHAFLPAEAILEIAPGHGRITHYLKDLCEHLTVVDVTADCIEACKRRFSSSSNIAYYVNDGTSLDMVPDHSIDFVISFDSLVHAEKDVVEAYLRQMERILKPNGIGFIHHSNVAALHPLLKQFPPFKTRLRNMWRAPSMSATLFNEFCEHTGLQCIGQEIINRATKYPLLHDCFSLFTPRSSVWARPNMVVKNFLFSYEGLNNTRLLRLYAASGFKKAQSIVPSWANAKQVALAGKYVER